MAEDTSDYLTYVLAIEKKYQDFLGQIRHWSNLKIAIDGGIIWVKDITKKQVEAIEIRSIPYKQIYYVKDNLLFPYGSNLPLLKMPSFLWTSIERGLPILLPKPNHNFFGIHDNLKIELTPADIEYEPFAMLASIEILGKYIETSPAVRLKNLTWIILGNNKALILGTPMLPIKGNTYWLMHNFLIPTGYNLELHFLSGIISRKTDAANYWMLWNTDSSYIFVPKMKFKPLRISSFRLTFQTLSRQK